MGKPRQSSLPWLAQKPIGPALRQITRYRQYILWTSMCRMMKKQMSNVCYVTITWLKWLIKLVEYV